MDVGVGEDVPAGDALLVGGAPVGVAVAVRVPGRGKREAGLEHNK